MKASKSSSAVKGVFDGTVPAGALQIVKGIIRRTVKAGMTLMFVAHQPVQTAMTVIEMEAIPSCNLN